MKSRRAGKEKETVPTEEPKSATSDKKDTKISRHKSKDSEDQNEKGKEEVKHDQKADDQKKDKRHQETNDRKKEDVNAKNEKKSTSKEKHADGEKRGKARDSKENKKDNVKTAEAKEKEKKNEAEKRYEKKAIEDEKKKDEKVKSTKERSRDREKSNEMIEEEKEKAKGKLKETEKKSENRKSKKENLKEGAEASTKEDSNLKAEEVKKSKSRAKKEALVKKSEEDLKENLEGSIKRKQRAIKRKSSEAEQQKKSDVTEIVTTKADESKKKGAKGKKGKKSKEKPEKKVKKEQSEVKGKRGFKLCRNPECNQFVHIHKKICPHCAFAFDFLEKKAEETGETLSKYLVKKKKGPKKKNEPQEENVGILDLDSSSKKKLFIRDDFVVNLNCYKNSFQPELRKEFLTSYQLPQLQTLSKNTGMRKYKDIEICFEDRSSKHHISTFNSKHITTVDRINQDFLFEKILNFGAPIETVSWAYTDPKNESLKNEFYFIVASQAPQEKSDLKNLDINQLMTSMALSLEPFSRFGHKTEIHGILSFYKLTIQDGRDIKDPELIYQIKHANGAALKMEWVPQIFCADEVIGFLYILTAGGTILAYLPPKKKAKDAEAFSTLQPSIELELENGFITSFAVLQKKPWNQLLVGDVLGNIFLIEVQQSKEEKISTSFTILRSYPFAHTKAVKELRLCPRLDENEEELIFSSSSDDGMLKIWNYNQCFSPLYSFSSLKRAINSHIWDLGGKFVIENMDFAPYSTKALVFENLRQEAKQSKETKSNTEQNEQLVCVEQRHISHPEGCLKCSNSYFSKYFGLTDAAGSVFLYKIESFRKALTYASKKSKTSSTVLVLMSSIEENLDGKITFKIKYTDTVKHSENENKKKLDDYRLMTNAFELLPNPILQQPEKENQGRQLKTIALCGNYLGIIRIIGVYT